MRRKRVLVTLLTLVVLLTMTMTTYAKSSWISQADNLDTTLNQVISTNDISQVRGSAKGRVISSAGLQITDEGGGVLGVYAETLCHTAVKEIYMVIHLDVWDDGIQDWINLDMYEYRWNASENPDRDLTDVSVSFLLEGLARGKTYSLRGAHVAKNLNNVMEVMSSETSGIVLD